MKVFSFGGGVQSTAALVLAALVKDADKGSAEALRKLASYGKHSTEDMLALFDYSTFLFANVGADSENPATLAYIRDVAEPFAADHGIELVTLQREVQGKAQTLYESITTTNEMLIPVRFTSGAPGIRACTGDFKIDVIDRWIKPQLSQRRLANRKIKYDAPATIGMGISLDEFARASTDSDKTPWKTRAYPLIDARLTRQDCENIIADNGLNVPPKSSCYFCPFHSLTVWQRMKQDEPDLFQRSVELEQLLKQRRADQGKSTVWLTRKAMPLDQVVGDQSAMDFDEGSACESGYCMT